MSKKFVFWLEELSAKDNNMVGKKCANLGEMTRRGFPVPPGFVCSIDMYREFVRETGVNEEISRYLSGFGELEGRKVALYEEISHDVRRMIENKTMPKSLEEQILSKYETLGNKVGYPDVSVSVRSAGTESRPGMFETYLSIEGRQAVLEKIKRVWSSSFTPRAIGYRADHGIPFDVDMLGVAVIKMVNARSAGVGFSINPVTGDTSRMIIEGNWGLGEGVVSGETGVDRYVVDKSTFEIKERGVGLKTKYFVRKEGGAGWDDVPEEMQSVSCINDEEIREIARLTKNLEDRLGGAQDMEWATDPDLPFPNNVLLLQTRPAKVAVKKPGGTTDQLIDLMTETLFHG